MGAAGLTSSSVEMAGKGGLGIELDLDRVPVRETGMTPYEIMLSESQERMLMILKPGSEAEARRIFEKWELDFARHRPRHRDRPAGAAHGRRGRRRHARSGRWSTRGAALRPALGRDAAAQPEIDAGAILPTRDPLDRR